mmetsp:Transcript_12041/g.44759  ORF Transcript_12041/g.44759 Transcript_12041/m.44759 type:complete len:214 (-) Transcript_12041:1256-1897(-)
MEMTPHTIHARTIPRDRMTMNRMRMRHHPMNAAANTRNVTANKPPAPARINPPAASSCSSIWSCALLITSSTVSIASSMESSVPSMESKPMESSTDAALNAALMLEPSSTRSSTVSTIACVKSLTLSRSLGASEKIIKHPAAVIATNTRIITLLITRSFFVNLRGLYAPLQHLQHRAPQIVLAMYTTSINTISTRRMMAIAKPGTAWPIRETR